MRTRASKVMAVAAAAVMGSLLAGCAESASSDAAGDFPGNDAIEMVAHTSPGGGWDTVSRALADYLPKYIDGAKMEVLNRTGGAGLEQYGYVTSTNDGHRIGPLPFPGIVSAKMANPDMIDVTKAQPLGSVAEDPYVVVASKASGITSVDDLASRKSVTVGSSGGTTGGDYFLNVIMENRFGANWEYVNHEGSTEATLAAIRGDVDIVTQPVSTIQSNLSDPNLVPLVVFSEKPVQDLPGVTLAKDVEPMRDFADLGRIYRVFFVSESTPEKVVQRLQDAVKSAAEDPAFVDQMKKSGFPVTYLPPQKTEQILDRLLKAAEEHAEAF